MGLQCADREKVAKGRSDEWCAIRASTFTEFEAVSSKRFQLADLEKNRFIWPSLNAVPALSAEQLHWQFEGIDIAVV